MTPTNETYSREAVLAFLQFAIEHNASDIFLVSGRPVSIRVGSELLMMDDHRLMPEDTEVIMTHIYALAHERSTKILEERGDDDFSFSVPRMSRFRVSAFKQRGSLSAVIRIINFRLPDPVELHIPESVISLDRYTKGMILITGPAGSGKSTTLAAIIDHINNTQQKHIITLEDPLEHLHRHNLSIVSQREIHVDTESYVSALRASLRQSPDVILLGEMRDYETMQVAMTAAETGHLLFSTLHTLGSANTINRIIDVFPPSQQQQIAVQLSMILKAIVSQQLVTTVDGNLMPVFEIMTVNQAIRNMIRDNKLPQIDGLLQSSNSDTLLSMDTSLQRLYQAGHITKETALMHAVNPEILERKLR